MRASRSERGLHNVPAGITSFVGRRQELAEIKRLFSGSRLVTLTGMGGVGKTRLALRVAIDIQRAFPDGVWLAELAALDDPALVTHAMFDALDLRDQSARWLVATLAEYLAPKHALIVLDNVEHLLDACAVLADTLLRSCPELRILVTSRRPLGISGEVSFTVPPLPRLEAVRLFAERAVSVVPGFAVRGENEAPVGQLCKQLEGIPLAIELAAARLNVLSVEQLLVRLQDRFALLTTGSRTALPRQQTLWRTIEWSYGLLSLDDQMLWQRLTVFSGSFDLEAIEQVCAGDHLPPEAVLDQVGRLVDQSILVRDATRNPVRYSMLESIRQFGREKLHESGGADFRRRHRDYYQQLVTAMQPFGASQVQWFDRLGLEHSNLRTALDYCLTEPGQAGTGMELASALWLYWETRGRLSEGRRWIDQFLSSGVGPSAV
jgi:predicted ATPase